MKPTKIIKEGEQTVEIDWSKPQWVINDYDRQIVITTGEESDEYFEGFALPDEDGICGYADNFLKKKHTPITKPLTIEISN